MNELFTNDRAQVLGNDQLHTNTAKANVMPWEAQLSVDRKNYSLDCSNGVCRTTWKPTKASNVKSPSR